MKKFVLFFLFVIHETIAEDVIYQLDDEDYYRMPKKYHLDRFEKCVGQRDGVYCTVWADLVSDQPTEMLRMIQAYTAHDTKHFNYSNIRYGLCLTGSGCRHFYHEDGSQQAMWAGAEACLNDSLTREYGLQARLTDVDCYRYGHRFEIDAVDVAIIVVLAVILALNVAGSLYDFFKDQNKPGHAVLMSFSIRQNWRLLVAPPSSDTRFVRLRALNGIRAMTSLLVILGHVPVPMANAIANPEFFEKMYRYTVAHLLYQGHIILVTFFTMSGFLLAYSTETHAAKHQLTWTVVPKAIFTRWLRLSPASLVVLMVTIIWYKFTPIGPLFKEFIVRESTDCRKYWLYNVLFATNIIDHSQCNLQVWFLGSDMQLHMLCLTAVVLAPSKRARTWTLAALYMFGVGWSMYIVYSWDLDATLMVRPNTINTYFTTDATFNRMYKQPLPNLPFFVMGMWFGYLVYDMQKRNLLNVSYRKYRYWYWAVALSPFLVTLTGTVLFRDGPQPPLLARMLFAPVVKSLFCLAVNLLILGAVCRCDDLIRGVLEWSGWTGVARAAFCAFAAHMLALRRAGGAGGALRHVSVYHMAQGYFGMASMTMIFATALHLLVEAPFGGLLKVCMSPPTPAQHNPQKEGDTKDKAQ